MICPSCDSAINPWMEMQVNGTFSRRCPRPECFASLPDVDPGTLADVFQKEDEDMIALGESPGISNVISLPSSPVEMEGLLQQMTTRRTWLLQRIEDLQGCVRELELVDRMLAAAKESEE